MSKRLLHEGGARPIEFTPDGHDVLAVRFDFAEPLDGRANLLLTWNGTRFVMLDYDRWQAGETHLLADTSDLWKSLGG